MIGEDVDGNEIKVGDMVKKVDGDTFSNYESVVEVASVYYECNQQRMWIKDIGTNISCKSVRKVNTNRHPHADLIHKWAEDTSLEFQVGRGVLGQHSWSSTLNPVPKWDEDLMYRIKPSKTPAELEKESILASIKELEENTATALSELQGKLEGLEV